MTPADVRARVGAIRAAGIDEMDDEKAHSLEDALYEEILHLAAEGADVRELAAEALKSGDIDFSRWCA